METIRDIVVIALLIGLTGVALVLTIVTAIAGILLLRAVRAARRLHDQQLLPVVDRGNAAVSSWNETQAWSAAGISGLAWHGVQTVIRRRAAKQRRRFERLRSLRSRFQR